MVGAAVAIALAACGFSAVGDGAIDGGPSSTSGGASASGGPGDSTDGGGSTSVSFITCDSGLVDPGLVILPGDGGACPSGTTEKIAQSDAVAMAGACACGTCTVSTEATCAGPNFTWHWASNNTCAPNMQSYTVPATANPCIVLYSGDTSQIDVYNLWDRTPTPGVCTAAGVGDPAKVAATPIRQCVPNANADVCAAAASSQRVCVPADLDGGACTGMYSARIVVGDAPTLTCGACGCTRTAADCNVEYHDNATCTHMVYQRPADNTCQLTGQPTIAALKVYARNFKCSTTVGTATASLSNARALCCTP